MNYSFFATHVLRTEKLWLVWTRGIDDLAGVRAFLLAHSTLTISEIAYQLDFKDVSYFCRFFRKQTGMSPVRFREEKQQQKTVILNY